MRTLPALIATLSILGLSPMASPAAVASPNSNANLGITAACQASTNFPDEPPGNCIAIQSTISRDNIGGAAPSICQFAQAEEPELFYYFYDSYKACVQDQAYIFLN